MSLGNSWDFDVPDTTEFAGWAIYCQIPTKSYAISSGKPDSLVQIANITTSHRPQPILKVKRYKTKKFQVQLMQSFCNAYNVWGP